MTATPTLRGGLALCSASVPTGEVDPAFPTQCHEHDDTGRPCLRGGGIAAAFPEKASSEPRTGGLAGERAQATFGSWMPRREGPSRPTPFCPHIAPLSCFWKALRVCWLSQITWITNRVCQTGQGQAFPPAVGLDLSFPVSAGSGEPPDPKFLC